MDKKRAYVILNIDPQDHLNYALLRKKYLKASLKYHPDKNQTSEFFVDVKEAYDYLLDDLNRLSPLFYYDEEYTHTLFILLKQYIYDPFEKHIHSYQVFELNPSLDHLFQKELYYMKDYDLYIPLWHHELWYETHKIKIKIKPNIPEYISIDIYNHIHIYLENKTKKMGDVIEFKICGKSFSFLYEKNITTLMNQGIPMIRSNIFEHNEISNVIIHLSNSF
jgi:hypothetical protein